MTGCGKNLLRCVRQALIAALILLSAGYAHAEKPLSVTPEDFGDHARIVLKWEDGDERAPDPAVSLASQVLILKFNQDIRLDLPAFSSALQGWAGVSRLDADRRTVRVSLKRPARLHMSQSADLTAVDLVAPGKKEDPADIVSPLIAVRAARAEAARLAALPKPAPVSDLEVRGSHSGGSTRIAFYWPEKTSYRVLEQKPGQLKLQFSRQAKADLAYLRILPPENLESFSGENDDRGYVVTIRSKNGLPIRHFTEDGTPTIDISQPSAQVAAVIPEPPPEAATPLPGRKAPSSGPISLTPGASRAPEPQPVQPAGAEAAPAPAPPVTIGGARRGTQMLPAFRDPAPKSGFVQVSVQPLAAGAEFRLPFTAAAPAAVFSRRGAVWAVFATEADLRLNAASVPAGFRARTYRVDGAALLRIEPPAGLNLSAEAEGPVWTIRLAPTGIRPQRFVRPERAAAADTRTRIEAMLVGAAGIIWFRDPVIGDEVSVVAAYGPATASVTARDFVEASLPATAHGLAILPRADDLEVSLTGERVTVSMAGRGANSDEDLSSRSASVAETARAAFIDFEKWGGLEGEEWQRMRHQLESRIASVPSDTLQSATALMDLSRFYLGHSMAFEAIGALRLAAKRRPELEPSAQFAALRGVANVIAGRHAEAEKDLAQGALRFDPSTAVWRGLSSARAGKWENAYQALSGAEAEFDRYPQDWASRFRAAAAEAAFRMNDFDAARRNARAAMEFGDGEDKDRARLVLAELKIMTDGPNAARSELEALALRGAPPVAALAELRRIETGLEAGVIETRGAAEALEALRFRWRGDEVETRTMGVLAAEYMRIGRYREALRVSHLGGLRDAAAEGSRALRLQAAEYFHRLFFTGEADRLDPVQALALFYEFADLTPIGTDGDVMVRKLVQRLVAFDLLEQAGELLQHQMENRARGQAKAMLAVDLAGIYLMDRRPEKALAAINASRQPNLPKELAMQRRLIEAAAYRDLGRFETVAELVEGLEAPEAKMLMADTYWKAKNWPEAARSLAAILPTRPLGDESGRGLVLRTAVAARLARDDALLASLRSAYMSVFPEGRDRASFELITQKTDVSGAALSEAVTRMADTARIDAFAAGIRSRLEGAPGPAQAASAPAPPAAAAAAAGGAR